MASSRSPCCGGTGRSLGQARPGESRLAPDSQAAPLQGPAGTNNAAVYRSPSPWTGAATVLWEKVGNYYLLGWESAGGLQGPNEPDNARAYWVEGLGGLRDISKRITTYKNARGTGTTALGGKAWVRNDTGRIETIPAQAKNIPTVGWSWVSGGAWSQHNSVFALDEMEVAAHHYYFAGHGPRWDEMKGEQEVNAWPYVGRPYMNTESGYNIRTLDDGVTPTGQDFERWIPPEIGGEYMMRTAVFCYLLNCVRTYWYKFAEEETAGSYPYFYGLCDPTFRQKRAPYWQLKNLLAIVGFRQPNTVRPVSVGVSGFTPGADQVLNGQYTNYHKTLQDGLRTFTLQTTDTEYLTFVARSREMWDRTRSVRITLPSSDNRTITLQLPSDALTAGVAEPGRSRTTTVPHSFRRCSTPMTG